MIVTPSADASLDRLLQDVFATLEQRQRPSDEDERLLTEHALVWARFGLATRALALLARWRGKAPVERTRPDALTATPDLWWDAIQGILRLGDRGPFSLASRPVLAKAFRAILARPDFAIPLGELYQAVWASPYDPAQHETKCHVALHRLRSWLEELAASPATIITVQDGKVGIAEWVDVRVVEWS